MARISPAEREHNFGPHCAPGTYMHVRTPWGLTALVHPLIVGRFQAACERAERQSHWKPARIDSYNCRPIRGHPGEWSLHSYGLAWDFFDKLVPITVWGPADAPDPAFRSAFEQLGFTPGATFTDRPDWPHIEWAAGRPAVIEPVPIPAPIPVREALLRVPNAVTATPRSWTTGPHTTGARCSRGPGRHGSPHHRHPRRHRRHRALAQTRQGPR